MKLFKKQEGFTLLEILLVVAAIAILAGIVILAINPTKQLGDTRNAQRQADVNTILNAVYQYALDNNGTIPAAITTSVQPICNTTGVSCVAVADLGVLILNGKYVVAIPKDPSITTGVSAGYTIVKDANNRVTVAAPNAEQGKTITVTR